MGRASERRRGPLGSRPWTGGARLLRQWSGNWFQKHVPQLPVPASSLRPHGPHVFPLGPPAPCGGQMSDAQEAVRTAWLWGRHRRRCPRSGSRGQDTALGVPSSSADPEPSAELVTPARVGDTQKTRHSDSQPLPPKGHGAGHSSSPPESPPHAGVYTTVT